MNCEILTCHWKLNKDNSIRQDEVLKISNCLLVQLKIFPGNDFLRKMFKIFSIRHNSCKQVFEQII